jgi:hypothetical protein
MPLGFSVKASANIWKRADVGETLSRPAIIADSVRWLQHWGGTTRYLDSDVVEVTFPSFRWTQPYHPPFDGVRRALLSAEETDLKIQITAQGESDVLVPLIAALVAYLITRSIAWHPQLLSPIVGVATAGLYWLVTWGSLQSGVNKLAANIRAGSPLPGA